MGYLTSTAVEQSIQWLATTYPAIATVYPLPETSYEGRTIRALKIAAGSGGPGGASRSGVLFLGGVHARELVNPDLLVSFAADLCFAYNGGTGVTYGGNSFNAATVKLIVEALDVWIFPLVNPDGRSFVQAPSGDVWWRKNRRPTGGCVGVDINRNYDFLWSSGIGTSADPCDYQIYKGPSAFSEAETRNVRHLLDGFANIRCLVDVHSYSEDILYPWGDDDDQTSDPSMNFHNPAYNGLRGTSGDAVYKEYIPNTDLNWYVSTSNNVAQAIQAVRGTSYTTKQSISLYPTTGTSDDYSYSRYFASPGVSKVRGFTVETGQVFQPPYTEALQIIKEVSAGLIEFCLASICVVNEVAKSTTSAVDLVGLRAFRDELASHAVGRRMVGHLERHSAELAHLLAADGRLAIRAAKILSEAAPAVSGRHGEQPPVIKAETAEEVRALITALAPRASAELRPVLEEAEKELGHFAGKTVHEGLAAARAGDDDADADDD